MKDPQEEGPFDYGGEVGLLLKQYDWSKCSMGHFNQWDPRFQSALCISLSTSEFPTSVILGKDMLLFYNDSYISILGKRHPSALGRPALESFLEIAPAVQPIFEGVAKSKKAASFYDLLLMADKGSYLRESYCTFCCSPLWDSNNQVGGIFVTISPSTDEVITRRQFQTLNQLALHSAEAKSIPQACALSLQSLETNPTDFAFSFIYLMDTTTQTLTLSHHFGFPDTKENLQNIPLFRKEIPCLTTTQEESESTSEFFKAIIRVTKSGKMECFDLVKNDLRIPSCGSWKEDTTTSGVLVVGTNKYRDLDANYDSFLMFCAGQVGTALSNARAHEEERKRAEALAELDRAKTTFFQNISHEFRTPLTLMLVPLEEMIKEDSNSLKERLSLVYRNGLRLLKLVNTLLDFSKVEANRSEAHFEATDLKQLTLQIATVFSEAITGAGLKFIVNVEDMKEMVYIDRELYEQMVLNIISNAFKYTLKGEIEVNLTSTPTDAVLSVRDTGNGISSDDLPRIFQRFYRATNSGGRSHEGTGIGLSMVSELVGLHGGTVGATSELGKGSTFNIRLPFGTAHLPKDQVQAISPMTSPVDSNQRTAGWWLPNVARSLSGSKHSPRRTDSSNSDKAETFNTEDKKEGKEESRAVILLADDNLDMREFVYSLLSEHYEVIPVGDGQEALDVLEHRIPDLILSDIMMPKLDGYGLLEAVRSNPKTSIIPVIFLSARAGEESVSLGFNSAVDDYVVKPFTSKELLARVSAHIKLHKFRLNALKKEQEYMMKDEAAKAKDNFLAILSHELRTPLIPALMLAETLEREFAAAKSTKERDDIVMIKRSISLEVRLIDDLLDLTKVSKGKVRLELETVDSLNLLEQTLQLFQFEITEKQLTIVKSFEAENHYTLSDPVRIQQIFWNMVKNAIKFTPQNGTITIKTHNLNERTQLQVSVVDSGVGISPSLLPKLFNPFEQGTSQLGGLGLGLYISRVIAALHQGSLSVSSEGIGKGSTFSLTLNTAIPPAKTNVNLVLSDDLPRGQHQALRILLIEDNKTTNYVMTRILNRLGHSVSPAFSARDAIEAVKKDEYDLIISDIVLEGLNGWETMKEIQKIRPIKGIALSGYGMEEDVKKSMEAGFTIHLTKPVQSHVLQKAITKIVS